jgi:hypothetical protein
MIFEGCRCACAKPSWPCYWLGVWTVSISSRAKSGMKIDNGIFLPQTSARLVDTPADIKPSFEDNPDIVPPPPRQSAFSNREKAVESDVEIYRKEA